MIRKNMGKKNRGLWGLVSLVAVAASVGLTACGGDGSTADASSGASDFADVQVGETEIEILEGGSAAVIRLNTDPPTVCAVAFGESEKLGRIANDPSMGGSAISAHAVVLRNLTPNATYHYRLTATDATGSVYQTPEPLSFVTKPPMDEDAGATAAGANVALGAKVTEVSSAFSDAFAASNALDGDVTTEWSSAGDGNDASVTIDLGKPVDVTGVAFRTREMADGSSITSSFTLTVDGGKRLGPFPAGDRRAGNVAAVSFTGRILRFDVEKSTGGNTGAVEIEVYSNN